MWRWLSNLVDAAADVVEDAASAVFGFFADLVEIVGNAIGDAFSWLGQPAQGIPGIGGVLGWVIGWIGSIVSAVFDFVGSAIAGVGSIVGGALAGVVRILGGILSLDPNLILSGFGDILSGTLGAAITIFLKAVALIQTIFPFQGRRRPLTPAERAMLLRIYGRSLALYNIRVVDNAAGVFGINRAQFVLGNTIYLKGANVDPSDPAADDHILAHESVHVWQYQHRGSSYTSDALSAQVARPATNTVGGWQNEMARGRTAWVQFNKEAQAWFVEDVYHYGSLTTAGTTVSDDGVFFDADGVTSIGNFTFAGIDQTDVADAAVIAIRRRTNTRLSQFL